MGSSGKAGAPAISGTPAGVAQSNAAGSSGTLNNSDHAHQGVTSVTAGTGITVTGGDGSGHGALTVTGTAAGAITQISQQLLGSPAASVTFSSIAGTYNQLILYMVAAVSDSALTQNLLVQFNGDTGSNYDYEYHYGNAASGTDVVAGTDATTSILVPFLIGATAPANSAAAIRLEFPGYAQTTFKKTLNAQAGAQSGTSAGSFYTSTSTGFWRSTAAITAIKLFENGGGNFVTGSVFTLYGLT